MPKINNIEALRNHALHTLEKLASGNIDATEAGVTGKLCENVISTIKTQLEYARILEEQPIIPFMNTNNQKLIECKPEKKLLTNKK